MRPLARRAAAVAQRPQSIRPAVPCGRGFSPEPVVTRPWRKLNWPVVAAFALLPSPRRPAIMELLRFRGESAMRLACLSLSLLALLAATLSTSPRAFAQDALPLTPGDADLRNIRLPKGVHKRSK